jgi:NAD(P)H dehydrogenase (quinone)
MHVLVIYAHPSGNSFTAEVLEEFLRGLSTAKHSFDVHDLYGSGFNGMLDKGQYEREMSWAPVQELPDDVKNEQARIQNADALAFIYPVWWSDCPAILKGWFDRVWSNGFAYFYESDKRKSLIAPRKALVLCTAGHPVGHLEETGIAESMRCIMLKDRLKNVGFLHVKMVLLGGMAEREDATARANLQEAFENGLHFERTELAGK